MLPRGYQESDAKYVRSVIPAVRRHEREKTIMVKKGGSVKKAVMSVHAGLLYILVKWEGLCSLGGARSFPFIAEVAAFCEILALG